MWETVTVDHDAGRGITERLKVPNGWIVRATNVSHVALVFVPDPLHYWELEKKK